MQAWLVCVKIKNKNKKSFGGGLCVVVLSKASQTVAFLVVVVLLESGCPARPGVSAGHPLL